MSQELKCVFAYGSNMDRADYDSWCVRKGRPLSSWRRVVPATLEGYRLVFDYRSRSRGGGAANVVPDPGHRVHGLALWVGESDFRSLDMKEGYPHCYDREELPLILRNQEKVLSWVYRVVPERQEAAHVPPTEYYWGLIATAAEAYDFPESYRAELAAVVRQVGQCSGSSSKS